MTQTNTYKTNKQIHEKHTDSTPSEVITMLKGMKKHEDEEHEKALKQEAPRSIAHKVTE